jgi:hypothetical protein
MVGNDFRLPRPVGTVADRCEPSLEQVCLVKAAFNEHAAGDVVLLDQAITGRRAVDGDGVGLIAFSKLHLPTIDCSGSLRSASPSGQSESDLVPSRERVSGQWTARRPDCLSRCEAMP